MYLCHLQLDLQSFIQVHEDKRMELVNAWKVSGNKSRRNLEECDGQADS